MLFARPVLLFVSLCLIIVLSFRFVVRFFFKSRLLTNLTNLFNSFLVPYFRHIFVQMNLFSPFLDAYTHLYIRVCLSIGPSVGPSVCRSVCWSVCPSGNFFWVGQLFLGRATFFGSGNFFLGRATFFGLGNFF